MLGVECGITGEKLSKYFNFPFRWGYITIFSTERRAVFQPCGNTFENRCADTYQRALVYDMVNTVAFGLVDQSTLISEDLFCSQALTESLRLHHN